MSWWYRNLVQPVLFAQDPEAIHHRTLRALGQISRSEILRDLTRTFFGAPQLPVHLWGLTFPNPVGLAAGMDKSADAVPAWETLGFGFVELGTVTWHPQPGNPQPRVFRAVAEQALVNRMGFNNPGAVALGQALRQWRTARAWPRHPVGINLGKSKITPLDQAAADYANSFRELHDLGDFFVVNVSSPNTPGLRQLQEKSALDEILAALQQVNREMAARRTPVAQAGSPPAPPQTAHTTAQPKPILVKIAPDLSWEALDEILEVTLARKVAGLVATNTTLERTSTPHPDCQRVFQETGGLSGRPLRRRSTEIIRHLYRQTQGTLPIVGVGGIFSAAEAWEKIVAGASLVQIYTGLVYEGPAVLRKIVRGLQESLSELGLSRLQDAVGREPQNRPAGAPNVPGPAQRNAAH